MWIPVSLTVKRLGSHVNSTFPFTQGQVRLIMGDNGSGKSIVTEGISIALLGSIIRKDTTISDLINDNYDDAEVDFLMKNTLTHMEMRINRKFSRTQSQKLILEVDGEEKKLGGIGPTEDLIFQLIGITKSDVLNYFVVHKDKYLPFFGSSDTVKKQVISRFSGATLINGVFKSIDSDVTRVTNQIGTIDSDISRNQGMIDAYNQQIEELVDYNPEKEKKETIKALEDLNIGREKSILDKVADSEKLQAQHLVNAKKVTLWENRLKTLVYPYTEAESEIKEIKDNAQIVWEGYNKTITELYTERAEIVNILA